MYILKNDLPCKNPNFSNSIFTCPLGIGGQTALKLIRQHGSIESILENLNKDRFVHSKYLEIYL
jgi:hypothetical protein